MIVRSPPTGHRYLHQNRFSPRLMAPTAGTVASCAPMDNSAPASAPLQRVPIGQSEHQTGDLSSADPIKADARTAYLLVPFLTIPDELSSPGVRRVKNGLNFNS